MATDDTSATEGLTVRFPPGTLGRIKARLTYGASQNGWIVATVLAALDETNAAPAPRPAPRPAPAQPTPSRREVVEPRFGSKVKEL